jgi:hypothetical protein
VRFNKFIVFIHNLQYAIHPSNRDTPFFHQTEKAAIRNPLLSYLRQILALSLFLFYQSQD